MPTAKGMFDVKITPASQRPVARGTKPRAHVARQALSRWSWSS